MGKLQDRINMFLIRTRLKFDRILHEERGDTNFISIAIVLGIVIVVAGVFIAMKDQIMGHAQDAVNNFVNGGDW